MSKLLTGTVCFSKVGFLAFLAMVINCTAGMERKSQKIEIVTAAAERYLGVCDLVVEWGGVTCSVKW